MRISEMTSCLKMMPSPLAEVNRMFTFTMYQVRSMYMLVCNEQFFEDFTEVRYLLDIREICCDCVRPLLWYSGQTSCLQSQRSRVRFPALPDFLSNNGSGTGSIQPL
jgi:hypothetical protein